MKKESKTIFEHLGIKGDFAERIKYLGISLVVFLIIGYIIGSVLDMYLNAQGWTTIMAMVMFLLWILKAFGKYLNPQGK